MKASKHEIHKTQWKELIKEQSQSGLSIRNGVEEIIFPEEVTAILKAKKEPAKCKLNKKSEILPSR